MFIKWLKKLFGSKRPEVDPASFGDPIALQTEWTPVAAGGSNFGTHKLVVEGPLKLSFRATWGARMFALVFIGIGVLLPLFLGMTWYTTGEPPFLFALFAALVGALFGCLGVYMMRKLNEPIVFDRSRGCFYKGLLDQGLAPGQWEPGGDGNQVAFGRIHALQIIAEFIRDTSSDNTGGPYYSYELNLVLEDSERVNVVDHGDRKRILKDAATLAEFLGVPLWDAS